MKTLFKSMRTGVDSAVLDKIKFILKDPSISEESYKAIGMLKVPSLAKTIIAKKLNKGKSVVKLQFDPVFTEKAAICPSLNDKGTSMLITNYHYEKMVRNNVIECINLIQRFDDSEKFKVQMDDLSEQVNQRYIDLLVEQYNLDKFVYDLEDLNMTSNSNK